MAEVVTHVTGVVQPDGAHQIAEAYRAAVAEGLGPAIEETFLLGADGGRVTIVTVWRRRADLEAMLASGDEPLARRLIREAGGTPGVTVYRIVERAVNAGG